MQLTVCLEHHLDVGNGKQRWNSEGASWTANDCPNPVMLGDHVPFGPWFAMDYISIQILFAHGVEHDGLTVA